ncbi:MAG: type I-E CRISPR-associated protein Cas7/Cse4/CasC [Pseudomonadota bacterium]
MSRFVQLHLLTFYAPSNLNRDDLNRPKTAHVGGALRLRVSSQSLKRAWRTSDVFRDRFADSLGTRTKEMGNQVYSQLLAQGVAGDKAQEWAVAIAGVFGKTKTEKPTEIEQLAHFTPQERAAIDALVARLAGGGGPPSAEDLQLLSRSDTAVDIAMFGRMLAANPGFNSDAAVQVAHAFTVNKATVEDDFFTAVDDLNKREEDVGAGHMGEVEFGSGVFYLYICVDCDRLRENLAGRQDLVGPAMRALTAAAATVAPTGKQNSFASRANALYLLAEKGDRQPRSLAAAFLKPVAGADQAGEAIGRLRACRADMDRAYGALADDFREMSVPTREGTLAEVLDFVGEACS